MNLHELIKHACQGLEPDEDFTRQVLLAAGEARRPRPQPRLLRGALAAALLLICLTCTAAATGVLKSWLGGVLELPDDTLAENANTGDLLLEQDVDGMHVRYGQFLCEGRFLYFEVEITKADKTPVTQEELCSVTFDNVFGCALTINYDEHGVVREEGGVGKTYRTDDGSVPGRERYTVVWTLSRHDYVGQVLHIQIWEPYEWEQRPDGVYVALNSNRRKVLAETNIIRQTPASERRFRTEEGREVRICSLGAELQNCDYVQRLVRFDASASASGELSCGVVLADGTRVAFRDNYDYDYDDDVPPEEKWTAASFLTAVDPAEVTALYLGEALWPLFPTE